MTQSLFDMDDLRKEGQEIKQDAFLSIIGTRGVDMTEETFNALVVSAFMVNNYVVRFDILDHILEDLDKGALKREHIVKAQEYMVKRLDSEATRLGNMLELVAECKTPGPRH